jgi:hypothetical protein
MEGPLQRLLAYPSLANDLDVCPRCEGSAEAGWVCEDHRGKPWRHAGCSAAGEPCVCNVSGAMLWAMVYSDALRLAERSAH